MFTIKDGIVGAKEELMNGQVPQIVKHGDNLWDAQDKIFRHIEDHLHRHLLIVGEKAAAFAKRNHVNEIIIGSHKPLFKKIEKHLPYPFSQRVAGRFVTELKAPVNEIYRRAKLRIKQFEEINS